MRDIGRFTGVALTAWALFWLTSTTSRADDAAPAADKTLSPYFVVENAGSSFDALPLKATDVKVRVLGVIAEVVVTQQYTNEGTVPLEARYVFPASTRNVCRNRYCAVMPLSIMPAACS